MVNVNDIKPVKPIWPVRPAEPPSRQDGKRKRTTGGDKPNPKENEDGDGSKIDEYA